MSRTDVSRPGGRSRTSRRSGERRGTLAANSMIYGVASNARLSERETRAPLPLNWAMTRERQMSGGQTEACGLSMARKTMLADWKFSSLQNAEPSTQGMRHRISSARGVIPSSAATCVTPIWATADLTSGPAELMSVVEASLRLTSAGFEQGRDRARVAVSRVLWSALRLTVPLTVAYQIPILEPRVRWWLGSTARRMGQSLR